MNDGFFDVKFCYNKNAVYLCSIERTFFETSMTSNSFVHRTLSLKFFCFLEMVDFRVLT